VLNKEKKVIKRILSVLLNLANISETLIALEYQLIGITLLLVKAERFIKALAGFVIVIDIQD
jgi:hypothetical protein